jgi:hypothetical protein
MVRYRRHTAALSTQLGGEVIVLHLDRQRYYGLNASAACLWRALEHGADEATLAAALVRDFGLDPAAANAHARESLRELVRLRFVEVVD